MKKQLLSLFSGLLLLSCMACQKNSDDPPSKTELLTSASWKFDKAMAGTVDISNIPQLACYKDNIIVFASNGTGTISEGANVCIPPAPANFTWSFQNNETVLSLSIPLLPGGSSNFNIVTLNETTLALSQDINIPPVTTVTVSFKH